MDACARRLAVAGYAATTTSAVAEEAGVSRGALQHLFVDRAELMVAVTREGYRRLVEDCRSMAPSTGSPAERVAGHIDAMLQAYGSPYAIAAYEVLSGERDNTTFMQRHEAVLQAAEAELDGLWLDSFADIGAAASTILSARRVARAAVLGLVLRGLPLGTDETTVAALKLAITALLTPSPAPPSP